MAKNTTKKIKELRGEKPTRISNEHLSKLQELVSNANKISMSIGSVEAQKFSMLKNLEVIDTELMALQATLDKEYGTSNVNITDGTILGDEQVN